MQSFKLTFQGEVKAGHDAGQVKQGLADRLGISDPAELARCFSGDPVTLREGLDRKRAADLFHQLDELGARVRLERHPAPAGRDTGPPVHKHPEARPSPTAATGDNPPGTRAGNKQARRTAERGRAPIPVAHKPNHYLLTPFRKLRALDERPAGARKLRQRSLACALIALLTLLAASQGLPLLAPAAAPAGASGMARLHDGGLVLVLPQRLLLLDRAGADRTTIRLRELGLGALSWLKPLADGRSYLVQARALEADTERWWRCQLTSPGCEPLPTPRPLPDSVALHPGSGIQLRAWSSPGALEKATADGRRMARAEVNLPKQTVLRLHSGLLYTNSAEAPALNVLRYDAGALGEQLDSVLLLAPPALERGREKVVDFTASGDQWWAVLGNSEGNDAGLYRFDRNWGYAGAVDLPAGFRIAQLLPWRDGLLVRDARRPAIARIDGRGRPGAALVSEQLAQLIARQQRRAALFDTGSRLSMFALGLLACLALLHAGAQHLRALAFVPGRLRSAPALGPETATYWLPLSTDFRRSRRRLAGGLALLSILSLGLAVYLRVEVEALGALLLFLAAPATTLLLVWRSPPGHLGIKGRALVLVDHRQRYHLGAQSQICHRGAFLMIDDILVFAGYRWCPVFDRRALQRHVSPLLRGAIKVDHWSVLARLLESRHPLAVGGYATLLLTTAALLLLLL